MSEAVTVISSSVTSETQEGPHWTIGVNPTVNMSITSGDELNLSVSAKPTVDAVLGKIFSAIGNSEILKNTITISRSVVKMVSPNTDTEIAGKIIDGFDVLDGFGAATGVVTNSLHTVRQVVQLFASKCEKAKMKIVMIVASALKALKSAFKFVFFIAEQGIIKLSESTTFFGKIAHKTIKVVLSVFKIVMDTKDAIKVAKAIKGISAVMPGLDTEEARLKGYLMQRNISNAIKIAASVMAIALSVVGTIGMFVALAPMIIPVFLATMIVTMTVSGLVAAIVDTTRNTVCAELAQAKLAELAS